MANYRIIIDEEELDRFIAFLPDLERGECYYASLFARKKYHESAKNDKSNVKRFIATTKEWLKIKLRQLEIEEGRFTNKDGSLVMQESLAMYICINPRSFAKAQRLALKRMADVLADGLTEMNPAAIGLTSVHKARSRTCYVDFDFDDIKPHQLFMDNILNKEAYIFMDTRGGCHLLVDPKKVAKQFEKTWYQDIAALDNCDVKGDNLIPIAGCTQGGYVPRLILDEDF